jgi:FXSXX-COOH protein
VFKEAARMDDVPPDIDTGLIDVTGVDLVEIELLDDSVLARALRRIIRQVDQADEPVAGFNSQV